MEGSVNRASKSQCAAKKLWTLSMNPRVLPASCRQTHRSKALPARCRQHLGGAVSSVSGSWSQCLRKSERGLSMNRNSQIRMTNEEIRRNDEIPMTKRANAYPEHFDIRASDFI